MSNFLYGKWNSFAKAEGKSRTEVVKESILEYIENRENIKTPYELGLDLIGKYDSRLSDLTQNRKNYLQKSIEKKHAKHSFNVHLG